MNQVASNESFAKTPDFAYGDANALLIVADSPAAFSRIGAAAAAAGMPIYANVGLEEALSQLARLPPWVAVELDRAPADGAKLALDAVLNRIAGDTGAGRYSAILSTPAALIDLVAPFVMNERVEQLADATPSDRIAALIRSERLGRGGVRETAGDEVQANRLRALSQEVARIAGTLARLTENFPEAKGAPAPPFTGTDAAGDETEGAIKTQIARIVRNRQKRAKFFDGALFADPAWDMLLDLAAARCENKMVAVSSLCIAAAVPPTTALRWIKSLCDQGLFVRIADVEDGRRVFIELSDGAAAAMENYLRAAQRISPLAV